MPQTLCILCCYKCSMYQVQIMKKAKHWNCKMCNEKQSFTKVYFEGSGKECRERVMKLNRSRGECMETVANEKLNCDVTGNLDYQSIQISHLQNESCKESRWDKYLPDVVDNPSLDDSDDEINFSACSSKIALERVRGDSSHTTDTKRKYPFKEKDCATNRDQSFNNNQKISKTDDFQKSVSAPKHVKNNKWDFFL